MSAPLPPHSHALLQLSAACLPDVPLPLALLRRVSALSPESFQQAQNELIEAACWVDIPGMGMLLPVQVWQQQKDQCPTDSCAVLLQAALSEAQNAMAHHSRLAQLATIRELGPHLLHFARQAEAMTLPESPALWQILGAYLQGVGKAAEAAACFQRALDKPAEAPNIEQQIELYQQLGEAWQAQGNFPQAEQALQRACYLSVQTRGETDARNAALIERLGQIAFLQNDFPAALRFYRQALTLDENARPEPNRIGSRWNNLGRVHQAAGDLPEALDCFNQAARLWQDSGVSDHHVNQALALKNIALVYQQLGQLPQARSALESAIALSESFYGPDHLDIGRDASLLAAIVQQQGEFDSALALFRRAIQIDIRSFGRLHPEVAANFNNIGVLLAEMGKTADARAAFEEALSILRQCAPDDHPYRRQADENLQGLLKA